MYNDVMRVFDEGCYIVATFYSVLIFLDCPLFLIICFDSVSPPPYRRMSMIWMCSLTLAREFEYSLFAPFWYIFVVFPDPPWSHAMTWLDINLISLSLSLLSCSKTTKNESWGIISQFIGQNVSSLLIVSTGRWISTKTINSALLINHLLSSLLLLILFETIGFVPLLLLLSSCWAYDGAR